MDTELQELLKQGNFEGGDVKHTLRVATARRPNSEAERIGGRAQRIEYPAVSDASRAVEEEVAASGSRWRLSEVDGKLRNGGRERRETLKRAVLTVAESRSKLRWTVRPSPQRRRAQAEW